MPGYLLALITITIAIGAGWAIYVSPRWLVKNYGKPQEDQEHIDEARKLTAQAIGVILVIFTLGWSLLKDSQSLYLTINQAAIGQYTKSIELINNSEMIVKTGGIYALGNITNTHPEYSDQVYRTVAAFINSFLYPATDVNTSRPAFAGSAIDAAIMVLGGRSPIGDCPSLDDLRPVSLQFSKSYLAGGDFRGLSGFRCADFQEATLFGAKMQNANLEGAHFGGAKMADWEAYGKEWKDATAHTQKWKDWERLRYVVNFTGASLAKAEFTGTSLAGAIFYYADLNETKFIAMNLSRVSFAGARNLEKAVFTDCCADDPPDFGELPASSRPDLPRCQKPLS